MVKSQTDLDSIIVLDLLEDEVAALGDGSITAQVQLNPILMSVVSSSSSKNTVTSRVRRRTMNSMNAHDSNVEE